MNPVMEALYKRRSVRSYQSRPVPKDILAAIIDAGNEAPSAMNSQPCMMLAAYSFGIGSCWVGFGAMVTDDTEAKRILDLKEDETIFGPILLGYPEVYPDRPEKREAVVKWI